MATSSEPNSIVSDIIKGVTASSNKKKSNKKPSIQSSLSAKNTQKKKQALKESFLIREKFENLKNLWQQKLTESPDKEALRLSENLGQFKISLGTRKIIDLTELKSYCCKQCMIASRFFKSQIPIDPIYIRPREKKSLIGDSKKDISEWYREFLLKKFSSDFNLEPKRELKIVEVHPSSVKESVSETAPESKAKASNFGKSSDYDQTRFRKQDNKKSSNLRPHNPSKASESDISKNPKPRLVGGKNTIRLGAVKEVNPPQIANSSVDNKLLLDSIEDSDSEEESEEVDSDLDDIVWESEQDMDDFDEEDEDSRMSADEYNPPKPEISNISDTFEDKYFKENQSKHIKLAKAKAKSSAKIDENVEIINISKCEKNEKKSVKPLSEFGSCWLLLDQLSTRNTNGIFAYLLSTPTSELDIGYMDRYKVGIRDSVSQQQQRIFENAIRSK
ncbi:putative RNA polymerase II subunit B1 CTD phosphatase RPAP2 [Smittium mucronatum]|uniref:protein-serine/threonine phosphatase n=1 Tax=Smittium mucronatum TaxID=133383 RepID=A0A1R0H5B6_9FUNG|nr:putative RNA polymerase II subunit B1 CTD phosphatase RPAP2 [Smittium mucronatum]